MKKKRFLLGLGLTLSLLTLASCGVNQNSSYTGNGEQSQEATASQGDPTLVHGSQSQGQPTQGEATGTQGQGGNENVDKAINGSTEGALDAGNGTVVEAGSLEVTSCSGEQESAYVEFNKVAGYQDYNVYISEKNADNYKLLAKDKDYYIQNLSSNNVRVDISGLKKGSYEIKISAAQDGVDKLSPAKLSIDVVAFDRSGYAHFNYTDGVGAYKDDGTLKDNAIVLYVTDATKNTVELTYGGKTVRGIGNILNSVGKDCGEAGHEGQCKKVDDGKAYYAKANSNQGILQDLSAANIPLVIRFVGLISESGLYQQGTYDATHEGLIDGLTNFANASTVNEDGTVAKNNNKLADYGGTVGDNGHMARMKSGKNITIEGIGNDAGLDGWGIHFMCESANKDAGKSFEVRNLVFMNTPEDAIGMEGVQDGNLISASVERCWIHHNTFLAPSIKNPAESDKGEGDGSCDFKRGMYYTLSYNYFEYCHKTNLVGSSDSSPQFNMTFHHNVWYNCGSRIPLLRQANIHFYNNYVYGDSNDKKAALSYVTSLRANSYMYSENNYYEGGKNVFEDTGGAAKLYGNSFVQCFGSQTGTIVNSREAQVSSNCTYNGKSYANFDTNPSLFYYDSVKKQSDCYLTTSEVARMEDIKFAGSNYRTVLNKTTLKTNPNFNEETPTTAVELRENNLPTSKTNAVVDNVVWTGITGYASTTGVKFRGKAATFKLNSPATMTIEMTASSAQAYNAGCVISSEGKVMISGSGSVVLEPGIYVIVSCQKDKDSYITKLAFEEYDSSELQQKLISEYNESVNAIPSTIQFNDDCYNKIVATMNAYDKLGQAKSEVTNYESKVVAAFNEYKNLGKAQAEAAISAIGTVTKDSSSLIQNARNIYNKLISRCPDVVVSNYQTLVNAEASFASFALDACKDAISAIGTVTLSSKDKIELAEALYDKLDESQKAQVNNIQTLRDARAKYNSLVKVNNVDTLIENVDLESLSSMTEVINAYDGLTAVEQATIADASKYSNIKVSYVVVSINALPAQITLSDGTAITAISAKYDSLSSAEKAQVTNYSKLEAAISAYNTLASQAIECTFNGAPSDSRFTVSGSYTPTEATINGVSYAKGVKMESKTSVTFTTQAVMTLTLHVTQSKKIVIDGKSYDVPASGILVIENLAIGNHTITKDTTNTILYYVQLV